MPIQRQLHLGQALTDLFKIPNTIKQRTAGTETSKLTLDTHQSPINRAFSRHTPPDNH